MNSKKNCYLWLWNANTCNMLFLKHLICCICKGLETNFEAELGKNNIIVNSLLLMLLFPFLSQRMFFGTKDWIPCILLVWWVQKTVEHYFPKLSNIMRKYGNPTAESNICWRLRESLLDWNITLSFQVAKVGSEEAILECSFQSLSQNCQQIVNFNETEGEYINLE